jgi:hypothetical protein
MRAFGPSQGKGRLIEMLRYIEQIPMQQHTSVQPVLEQHARANRRGGLLVLCSDLLVAEGLGEGLRWLKPPRWQVLVLHMVDPRELRPELQGPFELEDSETGQRISVSLDSEALETYRRTVTEWQEGIARTCGHYGARYASILTTWPLEQRVVPYLQARRLVM